MDKVPFDAMKNEALIMSDSSVADDLI